MENNSTQEKEYRMPMIGDPAPAFRAMTTNGKVNFPEDYKGQWVVLFSHPADFTPVCTTEFIAFSKQESEFEKLNTKLIGLSIDSLHSHLAWLKSVEKIEIDGVKIPIKFPVIADISMQVAILGEGLVRDPSAAVHDLLPRQFLPGMAQIHPGRLQAVL